MKTALAAAVSVALAAGGCGSDDADLAAYPEDASVEEQIQAVVDRFNAAAEELDAHLLCAEVIAPSARDGSVEECAEFIQQAMDDEPENWVPIDDVANVEAADHSATADGVQSGAEAQFTFVREDERWWMQVFD